MTARALLDRGSNRVVEELAGQPQVLADMLDALGAIYKNLGQHERAREHLEPDHTEPMPVSSPNMCGNGES